MTNYQWPIEETQCRLAACQSFSTPIRRRKEEEEQMAKDPVCGMQVDEKKAAATSVYQGTTYYFCAPGCKVTFDKNPGKFTGKAETHGGH